MENKDKNSQNEIDLIEISGKMAEKIGQFFKWITLVAQHLLVFLLRKILWFALVFVLILGYSRLTRQAPSSFYSTMMVARISVLDNAFAINYINSLNASLANPEFVQKAFDLPSVELAGQIRSIEAFWGVSYFGQGTDVIDFEQKYTVPAALRDTTTQRVDDRFYIRARVLSSEVQPYLTKGLIENINSLPYLQEANADRKINVQAQISDLNSQISRLDSLQRYEYFVKDARNMRPQQMGQLLLFTEGEKQLYHEEIMRLREERAQLESDLLLNPDPVTVIQGFETNLQHEQSASASSTRRRLMKGFLLTFVLALAWDNRKWLKAKMKEQGSK